MKVLYLGCSHFQWHAKATTAVPERIVPPVEASGRLVGAVLACLIAVEPLDDVALARTIVAPAMLKVLERGYGAVVLYPYASIATPRAGAAHALAVINELRDCVTRGVPKGVRLALAPFGWAKSFRVDVDQSSETCLEHLGDYTHACEAPAPAAAGGIIRRVVALSTRGDASRAALARALQAHESGRVTAPAGDAATDTWQGLYYRNPTSINHRGQPVFIDGGYHFKARLQRCITRHTVDHFGELHEMSSPILLSTRDALIRGHVSKFPAGQFKVVNDRRIYMLRYATCPQAIKVAQRVRLDASNMPYRVYEMADCYRQQRGGVIKSLLRGTTFTMPDMHVFCDDTPESVIAEFSNCLRCHLGLLAKLGLAGQCVPHVQFDAAFHAQSPGFLPAIRRVFADYGYTHALMGEWPHGSDCYYTVKVELQFRGRGFYQLSTVQLDTSAEHRAGLSATRIAQGVTQAFKPVILHSAPGSVERVMAAMLDAGYMGPIRPYSTYVIAVGTPDVRSAVSSRLAGCGVVIDARSHDLRRKLRVYWAHAAMRHPVHTVIGASELDSGSITIKGPAGSAVREKPLDAFIEQAKACGQAPNVHV